MTSSAAEPGARFRTIDCGFQVHRVPDRVVHADLGGQLRRHVSPRWYAVVMYASGRGIALGADDSVTPPPAWAIEWMGKVAVLLNRELHRDGHWIVAWSDAQEPVLVWRDGDGDIHLAVEIACKADRPETLEAYTADRVLSLADEALTTHAVQQGKLELAPWQKTNLAQRKAAGNA